MAIPKILANKNHIEHIFREMERNENKGNDKVTITHKNGGLRNIPGASFCLPYKIGTNGIIAHLETAALFSG